MEGGELIGLETSEQRRRGALEDGVRTFEVGEGTVRADGRTSSTDTG